MTALPSEYVSYFSGNGPREGALSVDPGWFMLWPPDEVERCNQECRVEEDCPGFVGFGSSGGGEMLAFDANGRVVMIPMIGMAADEAMLIAGSWAEFVEMMER